MTPPPMITALPEGLEPMVEPVKKAIFNVWQDGLAADAYLDAYARAAILAFLNAALDAGVAREGGGIAARDIMHAMSPDVHETGEFPVIIIRTGP